MPGVQTRARSPERRAARPSDRGGTEHLVADPAHRQDDPVGGLLDDVALEERDHRRPLRRARAGAARDCCRWRERDGHGVGGVGLARARRASPWIQVSARRTWSLAALPTPVTAIFTSSGAYSSTGSARLGGREHHDAGRARDVMALPVLRPHSSRSMASASGRCSAEARAHDRVDAASSALLGLRRSPGCDRVAAHDDPGRPPARGPRRRPARPGRSRGRRRAHEESNILFPRTLRRPAGPAQSHARECSPGARTSGGGQPTSARTSSGMSKLA